MTRRYCADLTCLLALGAAGLLLGACGGRTTIDGGAGRGVSGQGRDGVGSGGGGAAGMGRGADASACENVGCPDIGCGPGFVSVKEPGACCPVCKPAPCNGACTTPPCPSGSHLETPSGQCCPICVPDSPDACNQGKTAYLEFRAQLIEKSNSVGCNTSMDCAIVYEINRCVSSCGTAFAVAFRDTAGQNLRSFAETNCASCPPILTPPCPPAFVYCTQGECSLGGPPPP